MSGNAFDSSDKGVCVLCPSCGRAWPVTYTACPMDGASLAPRRRRAENVHAAETMLLGGRRAPSPSVAEEQFDKEHDTQLASVRGEIHVDSARFGSADPPTMAVDRFNADLIGLPPGTLVNNEYEIGQRLGAGAMGEVYAATHLKLGKRVAIKVMSPRLTGDSDAVVRFEQEARTLAQIQDPAIVDVIGFGALADGRSYFVMERLIGESLEDRLARGRLPFDEALDILDQIARALDAAHEHGVVHRDLKPANIFLARARAGERAVVKLLDFGLAKLAADIDRRAERTQSGVVIGTAMYISPEQARGPNVDARTDVYALGCIAYELVLGRPPFDEAPSVAAMIAAHLHHAPPAPEALWPEIPPALGVALRAMVAKEPAHRPTLAQLRQVIARFRSPSIVDVRGVATDPRVAADVRASVAPVASTSRIPAARRNPIPVVPIVAVGALGVALVVWLAINAAAGRSSRTVTPSEDARHSAGPQVITVQPMVAPDAGAPTPLAVEFDAGLSPNAHVAPQTASAPPPLISESPTVDAGTRPVAAVVLDATVVAAPVATLDASVVAPPIHRVPPKPFNPNGTIDPFGGTP